jgi:hypothetical protein
MRAMAKADNPPFGRKQQDWKIHEWSRPVSDLDLRGIRDKAVEDADHAKSSFAGKASGEKRREACREAPNPITEFITNKLKRDPDISGRATVVALKAVAENGLADGNIIMSDDGKAFVVMDNGKVKNRLKKTSVAATLSRLKNKVLTRTGSN